jgi:outer membrane lipoprotein SlyB
MAGVSIAKLSNKGRMKMKKSIVALVALFVLAGTISPAMAQGSRRRYYDNQYQYRRYDNTRRVYYDRRYNNRSFWDRHRDKLTVGAGAGAGALIGGIAGGGKGTAIGALLGAGGSALYTYKLRDRNRRYYYRR